jgi:hypothetical protein
MKTWGINVLFCWCLKVSSMARIRQGGNQILKCPLPNQNPVDMTPGLDEIHEGLHFILVHEVPGVPIRDKQVRQGDHPDVGDFRLLWLVFHWGLLGDLNRSQIVALNGFISFYAGILPKGNSAVKIIFKKITFLHFFCPFFR